MCVCIRLCIMIFSYTYIYTYIFIRKLDIMLMNAKWYPVPTTLSQCLPRSYDAGTTSMQCLLRWYYVNPVLTTLSLGPHHALWRLRSYYVNFEHVQNLTTSSLPFLQTLLRSYYASTTLIPFLPRSSGGSQYALALFRERSKDLLETWPGVTGVLN